LGRPAATSTQPPRAPRRTRFDLKKAQARAHILEGYLMALDHIDEVISIIRSSQTDAEASTRLIERFGFSPEQTTAILEMKLRRLTGLERDKIEEELEGLRRAIAYYEDLLAHEEKILGVIKEEMREIARKFGDKRRTQITGAEKDLNVEDLIADEDMVVTITHTGYVKRIPVESYRAQKRGGKGAGLDGKPSLIVFHGEESLVEQVRGSGRFDAATRFDEQRATVMGFHLANVLRCGGLRDEQVLRGAREAALAVDL